MTAAVETRPGAVTTADLETGLAGADDGDDRQPASDLRLGQVDDEPVHLGGDHQLAAQSGCSGGARWR